MIKKTALLILFSIIVLKSFSQEIISYPPHWYKGLNDTTLQLIINHKDIRDAKINLLSDYIRITKRYKSENVNYLMIDLTIPKSYQANFIPFEFVIKKKKINLNYPLFNKPNNSKSILQANDLMYLIMPDRFANADEKNDVVKNFEEKTTDRNEPFARHGGDLKGITKNINYLKNLGVSTLWLTPFQENNEPKQSYHGYAITNHYKTDPRLGTNEDYLALSNDLHSNNMKLVIDLVFNHIGDQHWMFKDKPFPSFIHQFDTFTRTNYRANTLIDPYASESDKSQFTKGWFDHHMPDLNLKDQALAKYMTQQTIWWLLYANVDAIRIDTYTYPDLEFMQNWYKAIRKEFPEMSIFGEIWEHAVPLQSFFTPKSKNYQEEMQNVLDFQFAFSMDEFVNQDFGWTEGVSKLYYNLSQDYLYNDPYHHVTFLDNHDLDRFLSQVNGDKEKLKIALGVLLTMRGIPCIFYGTEILMKGKGSHGIIREDFPGGWPTDPINKFESKNRSADENDVYNFIQKIQKWKSSNKAFENGKLMQFIPIDGIYVYFRYSDNDVAMIVYNSNKSSQKINISRFKEIIKNKTKGKEIISDKSIDLNSLEIKSKELMIIDLD